MLDLNLLILGLIGAQLIILAWWWLFPIVLAFVVAYYGFRRSVQEATEKVNEMSLRVETMELLEASEGEARQLSIENGVMAEISRIITSSLDTNSVFDNFAKETGKIIKYDGIAISHVDVDSGRYENAHLLGAELPGLELGESLPLLGTVAECLVRGKSGVIIMSGDADDDP